MADIQNLETPQLKQPTLSEAQQTVDQYGINPNEVLSAANVDSTLNNPAEYPTDLLGIQQYAKQQFDVDNLYNQYNQANQDWQDFQALTDDRKVSLSKIAGIKGSQATKYNNAINTALSAYQYASDQADNLANTLSSELQQKQSYQIQYAGAGIELTDDWNTISEKVADYQSAEEIKNLMTQYPGAGIDEGDDWEDAIEKMSEESAMNAMGYSYSDRPKGMSKKEFKKKVLKDKEDEKAYDDMVKQLELENMRMSNQKLSQSLSGGGGAGFDPSNNTQVQQTIYEAVSAGESWPDIVNTLGAAGADISFVDGVLKQIYGYGGGDNQSERSR